jgi:c-di-GMP-binding flagellar brake protein YcgR
VDEKTGNVVDERRRFQRVESSLPVSYKNLRSIGEAPISTLTKNISGGGARFKTNEFISLACRLVLEIALPTDTKPIKAISKVAWIRKLSPGDNYEVGNQFLEITKEDKSRIMDFISNLARNNL